MVPPPAKYKGGGVVEPSTVGHGVPAPLRPVGTTSSVERGHALFVCYSKQTSTMCGRLCLAHE
jgi:hypothetical protein